MARLLPEDFLWFAAWIERESPDGCLTVVTGSPVDDCLAAIGVVSRAGPSEARRQDEARVAALAVGGPGSGARHAPASLLVEQFSGETGREEVLADLSAQGKAASVRWEASGSMWFSCARRGKVLATVELYEASVIGALPATLHRFVLALSDGAEEGAVAATMVTAFTGVGLTPALLREGAAGTYWPVSEPIVSLPISGAELQGLGYPTPAIVEATLAATPRQRWQLARRSVQEAAMNAGLNDALTLTTPRLAQGESGPFRLSRSARELRARADRLSLAASHALSVEGDRETWERLRPWSQTHAAMEAMAYLELDDVTAALGSTYHAALTYPVGESRDAFHRRALAWLH